MDPDVVDVAARIEALAERADRDRDRFEPPANPPAEGRALELLREGAGQAIGLYVHVRTGGRRYAFSEAEWDRLGGAMNTWLELYAACYGHEIEARFDLRTAAELLVDTHDIAAVAQVLTRVPPRDGVPSGPA